MSASASDVADCSALDHVSPAHEFTYTHVNSQFESLKCKNRHVLPCNILMEPINSARSSTIQQTCISKLSKELSEVLPLHTRQAKVRELHHSLSIKLNLLITSHKNNTLFQINPIMTFQSWKLKRFRIELNYAGLSLTQTNFINSVVLH